MVSCIPAILLAKQALACTAMPSSLSPGLVAIVTRPGDECDILDSRETGFDSTDTGPEAQSWSQRCDCAALLISLARPESRVARSASAEMWWCYRHCDPELGGVQIKNTLKSSQAKWIPWGQQISNVSVLEPSAGSSCGLAVSSRCRLACNGLLAAGRISVFRCKAAGKCRQFITECCSAVSCLLGSCYWYLSSK